MGVGLARRGHPSDRQKRMKDQQRISLAMLGRKLRPGLHSYIRIVTLDRLSVRPVTGMRQNGSADDFDRGWQGQSSSIARASFEYPR